MLPIDYFVSYYIVNPKIQTFAQICSWKQHLYDSLLSRSKQKDVILSAALAAEQRLFDLITTRNLPFTPTFFLWSPCYCLLPLWGLMSMYLFTYN